MMNLSEFLTLNEQEKELELELVAFSDTNPSADALREKIFAYSESSLFKIALNNPRIDELLKSEHLNVYWNELWRRSGLNPQGCKHDTSKPTHEYLPIATLPSFTLLKGLFIYEGYRRLLGSNLMSSELVYHAAEYLLLASKLGCFFAMNSICVNGLNLLKVEFHAELAGTILFIAQEAAKLHWTPGLLLLANVYKELNKYKKEDTLKAINLPLNAYEALLIAQSLEESSQPMVNNAYQGKSINEASQQAFKSFFQIKMKFIADLNLTATDCALADRKATLKVADIKKQFPRVEKPIIEEIDDKEQNIDLIPGF